MTRILRGRVIKGRVNWDDQKELSDHLETLEGQRIEVVIREAPVRPTVGQHRYYRGVCLPVIAEHIGCSLGEAHRALKRELLPVNVEANSPSTRSTASISRHEFGEYLEQIVILASELGIVIPEPNAVEP